MNIRATSNPKWLQLKKTLPMMLCTCPGYSTGSSSKSADLTSPRKHDFFRGVFGISTQVTTRPSPFIVPRIPCARRPLTKQEDDDSCFSYPNSKLRVRSVA